MSLIIFPFAGHGSLPQLLLIWQLYGILLYRFPMVLKPTSYWRDFRFFSILNCYQRGCDDCYIIHSIVVQVLVGKFPEVNLLGLSVYVFKICSCYSIVFQRGASIYTPTIIHELLITHVNTKRMYNLSFEFFQSKRWTVVSQCSFYLHFSLVSGGEVFFLTLKRHFPFLYDQFTSFGHFGGVIFILLISRYFYTRRIN